MERAGFRYGVRLFNRAASDFYGFGEGGIGVDHVGDVGSAGFEFHGDG